jgi:hypothetical protein
MEGLVEYPDTVGIAKTLLISKIGSSKRCKKRIVKKECGGRDIYVKLRIN